VQLITPGAANLIQIPKPYRISRRDLLGGQRRASSTFLVREAGADSAADFDVADPHAMVQLIVERGMLREPIIDCAGAGVVVARQGQRTKQSAAIDQLEKRWVWSGLGT
jgi:hypothetical protein